MFSGEVYVLIGNVIYFNADKLPISLGYRMGNGHVLFQPKTRFNLGKNKEIIFFYSGKK